MHRLLIVLTALAFWFGSSAPSRACKYCEMMANPDAFNAGTDTYSGSNYSGGFPLDKAIDKFQPTTPAGPMTVIISAADLPKPALKPVVAAAPAPVAAKPAPLVEHSAPARVVAISPVQTHLLDGSLLGLAAAGGVFFWRTRRPR